jgi:hypothetical protein
VGKDAVGCNIPGYGQQLLCDKCGITCDVMASATAVAPNANRCAVVRYRLVV